MPHATRYLLWALACLCLAWPGIAAMLAGITTGTVNAALAHPTVTGTVAAFVLCSRAMPQPHRHRRTTTAA